MYAKSSTTKKTSKRKRGLIILLAVFAGVFSVAAILLIAFTDNRTLDFEKITIARNIETSSDIKIIHLSDMHFSSLQVDVDAMLERIKYENPDIIAITGDIVGTRTDIPQSGVFDFIGRVTQIAPVYFVSGNHEVNNRGSRALYDNMTANGVTILNNRGIIKSINGNYVTLFGLRHGARYAPSINANPESVKDSFVILLTHTPEWETFYARYEGAQTTRITPNLILAGHIHGGQIRMFGRGLLCPDTFLFPRYAAGLYTSRDGASQMVVSRGLGNSIIPWRVNNKPHIPVITVS